jgi:hypothetical protein
VINHASSDRSLLPREHGVYAEVLFPLATALLLEGPSWSGGLLALAITAAFLIHEPVLVLLGRRGSQMRLANAARARRRIGVLGAILVLSTALGLWKAPMSTHVTFVALLPMVVGLTLLVATRRERSLWGEGLVALVLCFAAVPVALACHVPTSTALSAAAVWAAVFLLGTATVHALFTHRRSGAVQPMAVLITGSLLLVIGGLLLLRHSGVLWSVAFLPAVVVSLLALLFRLSPKRLRILGWALVSANLVTLMILVVSEPPMWR